MSVTKLSLVAALERRLTAGLSRFPRDQTGLLFPLPKPLKLSIEAERISILFDEGAPPEPPQQQRINALARLRRNVLDLSRKEWMLISWGLCDSCGIYGQPIEEQQLFEKVMNYVDDCIHRRDVPRKTWFGLLSSYFSYQKDFPEQNANWLTLRGKIQTSLPILLGALAREKSWSKVLLMHDDLLTDQAGTSIGEAIFAGNRKVMDELRHCLPVPEVSWLWRKVIHHQLQLLFTVVDSDFLSRIDTMLGLAKIHVLYLDDILGALLTRYAQSGYRNEPHETLKRFALEHWNSPQIKTAARWSAVDVDVRKMVQQWFAKADLEHFFSLLQGTSGVDRDRLRYWLRFVDQIGYTRIVIGSDAVNNSSPDFRDFREQNKGRFGHLVGGAGNNNAFIMRIGDYYFVEFSGTGNACYFYNSANVPFDPDSRELHYSFDLKKKIFKDKRAWEDNRIRHLSGWQAKADRYLAMLGILPGMALATNPTFSPTKHIAWMPKSGATMQKPLTHPGVSKDTSPIGAQIDSTSKHDSVERAKPALPHTQILGPQSVLSTADVVREASSLAKSFGVPTENQLDIGGAFWVLEKDKRSNIAPHLRTLGMKFLENKGYWIN